MSVWVIESSGDVTCHARNWRVKGRWRRGCLPGWLPWQVTEAVELNKEKQVGERAVTSQAR
jgi:hypothetical protein